MRRTIMRAINSTRLAFSIRLVILVATLLAACTPAWTQEEQESVPLAGRGEELYEANCRRCHGGATGGQMMDIPPPHNANGHTWHHPDCQLEDVVLHGSGEMGEMMRRMMSASPETPRMPAFSGQLREEEVEAILAYIKTWWTQEQRETQARSTQAQC